MAAAIPHGTLASSGVAQVEAKGTTLGWLDPLTGIEVATLDGSGPRLPGIGTPSIIQTEVLSGSAGLPRLRVTDVLPEFWAQPSVWKRFLKGPGAYAGQEVERRPEDSAGRLFPDRRAWAYDPGLLRRASPDPTVAPGLDYIQASLVDGLLVLSWKGRIGWYYTIESTSSLSKPFVTATRVTPTKNGVQQFRLKILPEDAFFRVVETAL